VRALDRVIERRIGPATTDSVPGYRGDLGPRRPRGAILYLTLVTVARNCYRIQIRLEGELAEARVLYETIGRSQNWTDGDALLQAIVEGAVGLTQASYGGTGFPDDDYMVMHGWSPPIGSGGAPENGGMPGWPDIYFGRAPGRQPGGPGSRVNRTSARSLGVRNLACVPLQHPGRVIGVLFVGNEGGRPFTEQDVVRLRAFAHHAARRPGERASSPRDEEHQGILENLIASWWTPS